MKSIVDRYRYFAFDMYPQFIWNVLKNIKVMKYHKVCDKMLYNCSSFPNMIKLSIEGGILQVHH